MQVLVFCSSDCLARFIVCIAWKLFLEMVPLIVLLASVLCEGKHVLNSKRDIVCCGVIYKYIGCRLKLKANRHNT